ncbi:MAG: DASH family cryptochrome [Saprospiraceae bacterium]
MKTTLVWFKTDLRLHDNETLVQAIAQSDEIIPVYCFDEAHFKTTDFGFSKTGNFRAQFLLESLSDLDQNLKALGSGLIVVKGKPEVEIVEVARRFKAQKVFAKKEVAYEEIQTQECVEKELWKINCLFEVFSTSTLYHAQDLPFAMKDIPDVFTSFRKRIEKETSIREVIPKPKAINSPKIPAISLPTMAELGLVNVEMDSRSALLFKGGETAGRQRIQHYLFETKAISTYKDTRNGMIGANYSSKLSAWLSLGCISAREIYDEIKKYEAQYAANESTYWLIFELIWRDYFRFMMKKYRHRFFLQNGIKNGSADFNTHHVKRFEKWKNGQTGSDFVDANMLELQLTGFMSNRGRQNVASYLCNDLQLDWRYGAAYFEQQLIDYDVCSNWGNWAYLAGVGNDPRGKRIFNIEKQASDYDKDRKYRDLWSKGQLVD